MNGILSWVATMASMRSINKSDDEDFISLQDILFIATITSFCALSYVNQTYRNSERLYKAKVIDLTTKNNQLSELCSFQENKIKEEELSNKEKETKIKQIIAQVVLIATNQHSNLSK